MHSPAAEEADLRQELNELLALENWSRERLAVELDVSAPTVARWITGAGRPRPAVEGKLRDLLAAARPAWPLTCSRVLLRDVLAQALDEAREALHRHTRLSTRHETLDEICKLLFAHVVLARDTGNGLAARLEGASKPSRRLAELVRGVFSAHLPEGLSKEMPLSSFELRLQPGEDELAHELAFALAAIRPDLVANAEHYDVFNEVFGSFLADSFSDEKQLGQYLTPPEVVEFMVEIAMATLSDDERALLSDPARCGEFGAILDPSCGVGSFLTFAARRLNPNRMPDALLQALASKVLVGIDKSERMVRLSLTSFALLGADSVNLHLANALSRGSKKSVLQMLEGSVGLILTNPPFGAEFAGQTISDYELGRSAGKVDSELLFIERYLDWLREDGAVLAIVPDSVLTNRGVYEELRSLIRSRATIETIVSLPTQTFSAAGTGTKTSVLHLKRTQTSALRRKQKTYVALCTNIGYDVATRSSQRKKVSRHDGELPLILTELVAGGDERGRWVPDIASFKRWDASYHASLPASVADVLRTPPLGAVYVNDVAVLSNDRVDPRRLGQQSFNYIEISDVNGFTGLVQAKEVLCADAPSRARKLVAAGDVLVSTVRPERGAIGVVPVPLDGAVCSTGFAVLRPRKINPTVLAALLRTEFVIYQILRNNMGVAYPAVDEACIMEILLPIESEKLSDLEAQAEQVRRTQAEWYSAHNDFTAAVAQAALAYL